MLSVLIRSTKEYFIATYISAIENTDKIKLTADAVRRVV